MTIAGCPRCSRDVALHEGRPYITAAGAVELWHRACWSLRDEPVVIATMSSPVVVFEPRARASARAPRAIATSLAAATAIVVGLVQLRTGDAAPISELANVEIGSAEVLSPRGVLANSDSPPPVLVETIDEVRWPVPSDDGTRLDETYSSLSGWIHPVTASAEHMPSLVTRHFGAVRIGVERAECGSGHCGVDLHAPRGRPLVAVADGVVVRVERSELGSDGRSGRYVRLQHDDNTLTAYMHMDDVADVEVGDRVFAGQYVGTLGATAVYSAPPHLHFSLEVPSRSGTTRYVDPAPFLVRATIIKSAQRRHAIKPAL